MYKSALIRIDDTYLLLVEGDGMNLSDEDYDEGFVDYIMADLYNEDDIDECLEVKDDAVSWDGGMITLDKLCADMTMDEFIESGLAFYGWEDSDYELISFEQPVPRFS